MQKLRRLKWLAVFKPTKPSEAYALALLCFLLGGAAVNAASEIFDRPPWRERADRVCLKQGNRYVSFDGGRVARLQARLRITQEALDELASIRGSVPTSDILSFNSLLDEKRQAVRILERLTGERKDHATSRQLHERLEGILQAYAFDADQLGLYVCGKGTGQQ